MKQMIDNHPYLTISDEFFTIEELFLQTLTIQEVLRDYYYPKYPLPDTVDGLYQRLIVWACEISKVPCETSWRAIDDYLKKNEPYAPTLVNFKSMIKLKNPI